MARALECPACGARHRLDTLPEGPTFRCSNCGQALKVPAWVSSSPGAPPPPARPSGSTPVTSSAAATSAAAAGAPATARREEATRTADASRTSDSPADPEAPPAAPGNRPVPGRSVAGVSATVAATESVDERADRRAARKGAPAPATAPVKRTKVAWYWRMVAWIVAVPLGFVVTAWPAYELGFIRKDDLLDIFVGTGIGRYARIAIVTLVWALVTALLVQLLVEGGRVRANRRRRARAVTA